jgi:hypothetical protein
VNNKKLTSDPRGGHTSKNHFYSYEFLLFSTSIEDINVSKDYLMWSAGIKSSKEH